MSEVEARRGRPRKDCDPAPEERVLAQALHAFAIHGYEGVSVRELNRVLGVSHNLLHKRFGSKEGIWYAAVSWGFGRVAAELTQADDVTADAEVRLKAMIRALVRSAARNPDLPRLVTNEAGQESARLDYMLDTFVRPKLSIVVTLYDELVQAGRLREVPLHTFFYLINFGGGAAFSNVALTRRLFGDTPFAEDEIERHALAVADLVIDGLRHPRA
ncbi:TetR/AcrR family transcriptional regulator [Streptomyces sp. NPDC004610]|uniref:TetR/AcrR family transcriptional regulator n=1 Tax=unclassified Streptomyces TaxID=2593676 RepID=UPI0033A7C572